jgi:hypothetical protein
MNTEDDKLSALLRDWANAHAPPLEKIDELVNHICHHVNEPPMQAREPDSRMRLRTKLKWLAAGAAIAASAAAAIYLLSVDDARWRSASARDAATTIAQQDIEQMSAVAREMQEVFPGKFKWLMESGRELKLGLATSDNEASAERTIIVRFVVEAQKHGDRGWKPVRTLNFLMRPEDVIQTTPSDANESDVALWAYATSDGMISIDAELNLPAPVPIHCTSSQLQSAGSSTEIWQSTADGMKYRVFQSADFLDRRNAG